MSPRKVPGSVGGVLRRWQGIALIVAALVSTVWLGLTNQLILYIHPRYIVFTVVMAVLGLVLVVASFVSTHNHDEHEHEDEHAAPRRPFVRALSAVAVVLTLLVAVVLVVVPPATLTTATADQRVINSSGVGIDTKTVSSATSAASGAFAKYTVLDWSSLLRQTTDPGFYSDKAANVVGFITKDSDDAQNVFYVTRFVITCCAVDAQPVGVPVYLANWRNELKSGAWVRVTGSFTSNPSSKSQQAVALVPASVKKVAQPSDPYLY